MSIEKIIKTRRTTYQFTDEKVNFEQVKQCIEAAIWAPNHKMRQPWKFWILGENHQLKMAEIYAENRALKRAEKDSKEFDNILSQAKDKFMKIPQIVLVGQKLTDNPIDLKEDYAACACAIQNFQLVAHELSLGVQWSTGPIISDNRSYGTLGIDRDSFELIGALYMGFPQELPKGCRKDVESFLIQLD